jgi:pyridoxal phosphate enzyme (YggS family)
MSIAKQLQKIKSTLSSKVTLVAVSKTKPNEILLEAYNAGQRIFGENKVQELAQKHESLPKDIEWHMIGHLQSNKVKYIASFVSLIHAVDSLKLLKEINKQATKNDKVINVLLQIHIAQEESKFGFDEQEVKALLSSPVFLEMKNIQITGVMGMATNTSDQLQVGKEFNQLKTIFTHLKSSYFKTQESFKELSMGMSGDYGIAIDNGSTMIRVGSSIFGSRNI